MAELQELDRKARRAASKKAWLERNREYMKAYREANKEKIAAQKAAWYAVNRDAVIQRVASRYQERRDEVLQYRRAYYKQNADREKARVAEWKRENPQIVAVQRQRRRALKKGSGGTLSRDIADRLLTLQRGKCVACRCDLSKSGYHLDHIVPLSSGGQNVDENIQLLCPSCNSSKHARHPVDFMQKRGFLL